MSRLNKSIVKFKNEISTYELTIEKHKYHHARGITKFQESSEMYNLNQLSVRE
jgi:hypothetical protein